MSHDANDRALANCIDLLRAAQLLPATCPLQLGAEGSSGLSGGTGSFTLCRPHRRYIVGDGVGVLDLENDRGWHQLPTIASASIASAARRYSLASQSFARCR
jgi:hypothetical protein